MGLLLLLITCLLASAVEAEDYYWYKNGVVYQIYVRSFQDSNGDGIGDLRGIIQQAPYLESLGIKAIWLSPIYPSPNADYGYDISDMENINPEYGTLADFDELVAEMNARDIKVIMDFVPNHTSVKHPWFIASEVRNETDEQYSNFYIWKDPKGYDSQNNSLPPNNWLSAMGTGSAWKWSDKRKQFYLHTFLEEQADLNYDNPVVLKKMSNVLKFWMRRGVAGFRMDAVSVIYDNLACGDEPRSPNANPDDPDDYNNLIHKCTHDQPETFDIIKSFRHTIDHFEDFIGHKYDRIMMTEIYADFNTVIRYYGERNSPGATFPFNFFFITEVNPGSNSSTWRDIINEWLNLIEDDKWPNWVLGNHDQHRAASRFSNEWVDLLHILTMTLPGTVITYNGEEIGLKDSMVRFDQGKDLQGLRAGPERFVAVSRDFERGPMPWNASVNGGFTTGHPWLPLAPNYVISNVDTQSKNRNSHLNVYKALVNLRKTETMAYGDCRVQTTEGGLIILTRYLRDHPTIIAVLNIGDYETTVDLNKHRNSVPLRLKIVVGSYNFPYSSATLLSSEVYLPPKSGAVLTTYSN